MNLIQQTAANLEGMSPSILCVNMRCEWVSEDGTWIAGAQQVLNHARSCGWRIAHTHSPRRADAREYGPIPGLEPLRLEPVFGVLGLSALHTISVRQWAEESAGPLYLIGALYGLVGAATVVGAYLLEMPVALIGEACGDAADKTTPEAFLERTQIGAIVRSVAIADLLVDGAAKVVDLSSARTEH